MLAWILSPLKHSCWLLSVRSFFITIFISLAFTAIILSINPSLTEGWGVVQIPRKKIIISYTIFRKNIQKYSDTLMFAIWEICACVNSYFANTPNNLLTKFHQKKTKTFIFIQISNAVRSWPKSTTWSLNFICKWFLICDLDSGTSTKRWCYWLNAF